MEAVLFFNLSLLVAMLLSEVKEGYRNGEIEVQCGCVCV